MSRRYLPSADWAMLRERARLLAQLRRFFAQRDFVEVETPLLSAETVVDRHLDPVPVTLPASGQSSEGRAMWLQTSPELAMKRLLAAADASPAIYQITRSFRAGECSPLHNPEFTMVEWYRLGDGYQQGMDLLAELIKHLRPEQVVHRVTYRDAFRDAIGSDPFLDTLSQLRAAAVAGQPHPPSSLREDREAWLDFLFAMHVQPHLATRGAVIVYDFPASQAALARLRTSPDPDGSWQVAERFELFVDGIELANGYHELLDAEELSQRNRQANEGRIADGKQPLPEPRWLLEAMQSSLPPCAGVALGFDRLALVLSHKTSLDQVLPFPLDRA